MKLQLSLKKYYQTHFTHIHLSKFIKTNNSDLSKLIKIEYAIRVEKMESTHFLYLFLWTTLRPRLRKFYTSYKNRFSTENNVSKHQQKSLNVNVYLKNRHSWKFLYQTLFSIIPSQMPIESDVFKITPHQISIFIENVPLTYLTLKLQSPHHYVALLPLDINFTFECTSLFERLYILQSLKFLKISTLPGLQ